MHGVLTRSLLFNLRGERRTGELRVGPVRVVDGRWCCEWSLDHLHPEVGRIYGRDGIDAVRNGLGFVGDLIRGSAGDGFIVHWHAEGDNAGFASWRSDEPGWHG